MSDVGIDLQVDRQEALFFLMKVFIDCSVIRRGQIEADISKLNKIIEVCVRQNKYLNRLEVWYVAGKDKTQEKKGEVYFEVDWDIHSIQVDAGKDKFSISEDDVLGSINPLFRKFADALRVRSLRDGVDRLYWSVNYVQSVYDNKKRHSELNSQLGLMSGHSETMTTLNRDFEASERERIKVRTSEVSDLGILAIWRK